MKNVIYKGRDNSVVMEFGFTGEFAQDGLNNFDDIQILIGGEIYTLLLNPENVVIDGTEELRLSIGGVTSLDEGRYVLSIIGINTTYNDGIELNQCDSLPKVIVRDSQDIISSTTPWVDSEGWTDSEEWTD